VYVLGFALLAAAAPDARGQDSFFESGGARIRYVELGHGVPVVLLHGIAGRLEDWVAISKELAKDRRVIALDLRGHGESSRPHSPDAYGPEMALDVTRLLDHLGIIQADVVGYSLGANIAAQLLVLHPERLRSVVLIAGRMRLHWTDDEQRTADTEADEEEHDCISRTLISRLSPPKAQPTDSQFKAWSAMCMADSTYDRFAIAAITRSRRSQTLDSARLAAQRTRLLAIVGSLDTNRVSLMHLRAFRPDMRLIIVEGAKHGNILEQPETLSAVRSFLSAPR